jgi:hypothetical protein
MIPLRGLSDKLHFESADSFALECDAPDIATDGTNLVTRAVRACSVSNRLIASPVRPLARASM